MLFTPSFVAFLPFFSVVRMVSSYATLCVCVCICETVKPQPKSTVDYIHLRFHLSAFQYNSFFLVAILHSTPARHVQSSQAKPRNATRSLFMTLFCQFNNRIWCRTSLSQQTLENPMFYVSAHQQERKLIALMLYASDSKLAVVRQSHSKQIDVLSTQNDNTTLSEMLYRYIRRHAVLMSIFK